MTLKIKRILAAWIDFMICTMLTSGIIEFILIPFSKFQDNAIFIVISMIAYVVTFFGFLLNKDRIFENACGVYLPERWFETPRKRLRIFQYCFSIGSSLQKSARVHRHELFLCISRENTVTIRKCDREAATIQSFV